MGTQQDPFEGLRGRLEAPRDAGDFVPPPRFQTKTFASYEIDPGITGQAEAVHRVQEFVAAGPVRLWQWGRRKEPRGLYLDGDFGVGKTHLLAAAWHACGGSRTYLSFSEAISLTVLEGAETAADLLAADILCIDEFELDDPSNTRLADLLIDRVVSRGTRLIVTSNTVPGELGVGRMFVDQFRAQLARVAATFSDVHVPGHDYRQKWRTNESHDPTGWGGNADLSDAPHITAAQLDRRLQDIPTVSLRRLAEGLNTLVITELGTFTDQLPALRFVHFIDRCYDWQVRLKVQATCHLQDLFCESFRNLGYAKKYRRCISRLAELCREDES